MGLLAPVAAVAMAAIGCAGPSYQAGAWPKDVPAESRFAAAYGADARNREFQTEHQYFDWVLRFYKGNGLVPGWLSQEQTLETLMGAEGYASVGPKISALGRIVACEWAKDNQVRRIDSDLLILWGNVLKRAAKDHRANHAVERLTSDAQAIVAGELAKTEIKKDRYVEVMAMK